MPSLHAMQGTLALVARRTLADPSNAVLATYGTSTRCRARQLLFGISQAMMCRTLGAPVLSKPPSSSIHGRRA